MNLKRKSLVSLGATALLALAGIGLSACSASPSSQQQQQQVTESYAGKLNSAEPYPLAQMNDSAERANLRERLIRLNDPHKVGYLYELGQNGQVIAQYTIKGKISSTASQLSNSQNINSAYSGNPVTESMSDDGSYGPEEGGQNGIFFFTTSGAMVEWNGMWQYSDAPLTLTTPPLVTMDANAKPTSSAGQLK